MKKLLFFLCYFTLPALFAQTEISHFKYGAPNTSPFRLNPISVPGNDHIVLMSHLDGYSRKDPVMYLNSVSDSTEILPDAKAKYITDLRSSADGNLEILVMDEHNTVYVLRTVNPTAYEILDKFQINIQRYLYDPLPFAKFHGEEILYSSNEKWFYRSDPNNAIAETRGRPRLVVQTEDHAALICTESILLDGKNYSVNTSNYENFFFEEGRLFASNHRMFEFNPKNSAFELVHPFYMAKGKKVFFVHNKEDKIIHEYYRASGSSVNPVDSSIFYNNYTIKHEDFTLEVNGPVLLYPSISYNAVGTKLHFIPENYPRFNVYLFNQHKPIKTKVLQKHQEEVLLEVQYVDYQVRWIKVNLQDSTKTRHYRPLNALGGTTFLTEFTDPSGNLRYSILDTESLREETINNISLPRPNVPYPMRTFISAYSHHVEVTGIYGLTNYQDYSASIHSINYLVPLSKEPADQLYSAKTFMASESITKGVTNYYRDTLTIRDFKTGIDTHLKLDHYLNTSEYAAYFLSNDLVYIPTYAGLYRYDFTEKKLELAFQDFTVVVDPGTENILVHTRLYFENTFEYFILNKDNIKKRDLGKIYGPVELINNLLICRTNTGLKLFKLNSSNEFIEVPHFWKGEIKSFARFDSKILALSKDNILYTSEDYPAHVSVDTGQDPSYTTKEDLYFPDLTNHKLIRYNAKTRKFYLLNEGKVTFQTHPNSPPSFTVEREKDLIISYIYGGQIHQHQGSAFKDPFDYSIQAFGPHKGCYVLGSYDDKGLQVYAFPSSKNPLQWLEIDDLREATSSNEAFQVKVYPNPSADYMQIQANGVIDKVEIWDLTGKRLRQGGKTNRIDVKELPENTYILKVESGLKQSYTRIIIRK